MKGKCYFCFEEDLELFDYEDEKVCQECIDALEEKRQVDDYWRQESEKYYQQEEGEW